MNTKPAQPTVKKTLANRTSDAAYGTIVRCVFMPDTRSSVKQSLESCRDLLAAYRAARNQPMRIRQLLNGLNHA